MANPFDVFDNPVTRGARDVGVAFSLGANGLVKMAGDLATLTTGKKTALSKLAQENIEYLQRQKSPELIAAEQEREAAVNAEENPVYQAWSYIKSTASNPLLAATTAAETAPSSVGAGALGAGARMAAGKLLAKKGSEFATKVGVGTALGAGTAMQAADVGGDQFDELLRALEKMDDETAMQIPQVADLVENKGSSIAEAKGAIALDLARKTAFGAGAVSALSQLAPGGRTIERALVGGTKKAAGQTLGRTLLAGAKGAVGEATQESFEEAGGQVAKNILARPVEPEREITAGVGPAVGQAVMGAGALGGAAGIVQGTPSRPTTQPAPESETTAGKTGEAPASAATKKALAGAPEVALESSEGLTPEQFFAAVNIRQARLLGGEPDPEDVRLAGEVPPPKTLIDPEEMRAAVDETQKALDEWKSQNPSAPQNIVIVFDPEMLHNNYGIQGAFNPRDGSIFINSAFVAPENVGKIASHEWAHQTLATPEGQQAFAEFIQREIPQAELDALAARYGTQDRRVLLEEWIAENQEKAPGVIERIVARIREWLAGVGIVDLSDAEVADIMLRTLRQQAENRIQPDTSMGDGGAVPVDPNAEAYNSFIGQRTEPKMSLQKLPTAGDVVDANGNLKYTIPQKTLDVSHYSNLTGLTDIDPAFYGTGSGQHYHRMMKGINKSFFFVGNSKPRRGENVSGDGMTRYRTNIDSSRIYDMDKDPLSLWFAANPEKSEGMLKELGYDGFLARTNDNRSFIALFYPTNLETGELSRATTPETEPQTEIDEAALAKAEAKYEQEQARRLRRALSGKFSLTEQEANLNKIPRDEDQVQPAVETEAASEGGPVSEILTRFENEVPRAIRSFYENFVHPDARGGQEVGGVAAGGNAPGAGAERSGVQSRAAAVDSGELTGTGRGFTSFFSDVSAGKRGTQNTGKKYTPVIPLSDKAKDFAAVRQKYRGNFDNHIATSIPGFEEVQSIVGKSIVDSYPEGATMLDIGASEGALIKAITESSGGKILTTGLDPNVQMASHFDKNPVEGSKYLVEAYGSKSDEGKSAWTEDDGTEIKYYDPKGQTFDIIHEAMVFQFISNARNAQVQRMKQLLKPDGVIILEEKLANRGDVYRINEEKKDRYKSQYYTPEEMEKKRQEVLQAGGDKVEGMTQLQVSAWELEEALAKNFQHVAQFWDSGNFKGYVASNNREALDRLLSNIDSTETEYSTVPTPREVTLPKAGSTKFSLTESRPDKMGFFSPLQRAIDTMPPGGFSDYVATPAVAGRSFPARTIRDKEGNVIKEIPARTEPDKPARIVTAEEQLRSHLEKYNVKKEEMDDIRDLSGQSFSDWIKDNSKATKDQIAQFVAENQVSVTPVPLEGEKQYEITQDGERTELLFDSPEAAREHIESEVRFYQSEFTIRNNSLYDPSGEEILRIEPSSQQGARTYKIIDPNNPDSVISTSQFTLGEARDFLKYQISLLGDREYERYNVIGKPSATFEPYTLSGGENYQEDVLTLPKGARGAGYRSNHYPDIPNYLAHVRTKDRVTTSGRPVLFVEEIQSDLHQQGREKGYKGTESQEAKTERFRQVAEIRAKMEENGAEQDRVYTKRRELESDLDDAFRKQDVAEQDRLRAQIEALRQTAANLERIYARLQGEAEALSQVPNEKGLPSAPFKKTWHEMAFKYLLYEAVRNGVDYLAWTTGEQQNNRYPGLATQVRAIEWNTPATYELPIALRDGKVSKTDKIVSLLLVGSEYPIDLRVEADGTVHPLGRGNEAAMRFEGSSLSELIGADVASRILNEPSGRVNTQDLVIDSGGMTGFYDQILPQFAAKYLKKFGIKPQKISVVLQEQTEEPSPLNIPGEEDRTVTMPRTAAEVNAVLITPEMEEEFRTRGQPRYSLTSAKPRSVSTVGVTRETLNLPLEGAVPKSAVAKALNDMSRGLLGGEEFDDDQLAIAHGVMNAVAEGRHQLLLGDKSGADWYDTDIDTAKKYLRRALPGLKTDTDMVLFTAVMAPTSFGQNPLTNVATAVRIYEAAGEKPWGNLPPRQESGKGWTTRGKAVELGLSRLNQLVEERGERGTVAWLLKKHPISELRKYNKNVSGRAGDLKYGAYIFGPKGGPFFLNMNGIREEMTKDLWWSRTFNRWFGTMEETVRAAPDEEGEGQTEQQEEAEEFRIQETPRNDAERRRMDAIANQAAQRLGLTIEELQATLWYYEQQLWKRLGAKVESYSFKDGALRILEKRGIERPRVRRSDSPNEQRRQAAYLLAASESRPQPVETQRVETRETR